MSQGIAVDLCCLSFHLFRSIFCFVAWANDRLFHNHFFIYCQARKICVRTTSLRCQLQSFAKFVWDKSRMCLVTFKLSFELLKYDSMRGNRGNHKGKNHAVAISKNGRVMLCCFCNLSCWDHQARWRIAMPGCSFVGQNYSSSQNDISISRNAWAWGNDKSFD